METINGVVDFFKLVWPGVASIAGLAGGAIGYAARRAQHIRDRETKAQLADLQQTLMNQQTNILNNALAYSASTTKALSETETRWAARLSEETARFTRLLADERTECDDKLAAMQKQIDTFLVAQNNRPN